MGTKIQNLQITKVVDGDTLKVTLNGVEESLRLTDVDTEESWPGGDKPVTQAGLLASSMAKSYFAAPSGALAMIDIEFDTFDPVEVCLTKHRDNYGRLLCYVHKGGENYSLKLVREGWSPYFVKYGRSRAYHTELTQAEAEAQAFNRVIWDPATNQGGPSRNYDLLIPWWYMRAQQVDDYRSRGDDSGVLDVRLNYTEILIAAKAGNQATIFCDLQGGINKWLNGGALIYAGSEYHKFNLWIPDANSAAMAPLLRLLEKRYVGERRGYVYVSGKVEMYSNKPEIVLTDVTQLGDFPPS